MLLFHVSIVSGQSFVQARPFQTTAENDLQYINWPAYKRE
jgi:hypothetical protein